MARQRQAIRCKARSAVTGKPCRKYAMAGQKVCDSHGGMTPQALAAVKARRAEEEARYELARLGAPPVTNALEELARLAGQVVAFKDAVAEKVNSLTEIRYTSKVQIEQLRSELGLWERALDRCVSTLSAMARLKLDERLVAIEEGKAAMLAEAMTCSLAKAGVTGDDATVVRREFARRLRVVS